MIAVVFLCFLTFFERLSVLGEPSLGCLCGHTLDVLLLILGLRAAVYVEEVVASLGNVEGLLVACGVTEIAYGILFYDGRGGGIIFNAANDLFHSVFFLFYIYVF